MNLKITLSISLLSMLASTSYTSAPQNSDAKKADAKNSEISIIKMPSAQVIRQRLCALSLDHFREKTGIDNTLGDQKRTSMAVFLQVETSLNFYSKFLKDNGYSKGPMMAANATIQKGAIIEMLLQDSPAALIELKEQLAAANTASAAAE